MILSKKDFKKFLAEDKKALGCSSLKRPRLFLDDIWRFEILLRKCEFYINCKKGIFNMIVLKFLKLHFLKLSKQLGFSIPFNVFGQGLSIAHRGTIVVSNEAKIGNYCRIHEGVTVGVTGEAYWGSQKNKAPTIGNNVFLGTGCKIIGDVNICDDVAIGANSVVIKSISERNTTWAGVPAKCVSHNGSYLYINK